MTESNEIGKLFRENFKDFEVQPPDTVWQQIQMGLPKHQGSMHQGLSKKHYAYGTSVLVIVAIFIAAYFTLNHNQIAKESTGRAKSSISILQDSQKSNQTTSDTAVTNRISDPLRNKSDKKSPEGNHVALVSDATQINVQPSDISQPEPNQKEIQIIESKTITPNNFAEKENQISIDNPLLADDSDENADNPKELTDTLTTEISATEVHSICKGEEVMLSAGPGSRYWWSTGAGSQSVVISPEINSSFTVDYFNEQGKKIKQTFEVIVLECSVYVPKAFSPNDDGNNDIYKVRTDGIHQFEIKIFSKWGELVFESKNPEIGWEGRIKGNRAPMGVYIFQVSFKDIKDNPRAVFGTLTLLP